ncbi:MFS transporter [Ferrimicrobium acidiphilum]|jgi:MFS family permease|uniref:MFS transporter n=1 Tax=Ferrimicrobium acidiphilum TaxID=121039 RepID=UPI0023F22076|nr:MFS transporter [Ferrimicrobium acidiphilum]MCL5053452.1 MFS transporter [Gammaproteobacteria bacterium]
MESIRKLFENTLLRRFLIARALANLGFAMVPVALSFMMLDIFHSAADLGLVLGGEAITLVAGLLGAGIIADRVSRARLLVLADLMTGIAYIALGLFGHFGLRNIWPYVGAGGIIGVGSALFGVSMDGWVQANVYGDLRQSVNAARSIYRNLASIMGPLIAAVLVALTSPPLAILIAGFLPLIASYIFATTKSTDVSTSVSQPTRTGVFRDLKEGWSAFSSRPWIWSIDLQFAIWHVVTYAPIIVLGPLLAKEYYHGAPGWAAILAALAVGGVIGGVVAFRSLAKHPLRVAVGSLVLMAPFPATLGLHLSLEWVALASLLAGAGLEYSGALYSFSVQAHVPKEVISRVSSFDYLASVGLLPVGYVLAVPLAHLLSLLALFTIGAVYTVFSAIVILSVRSVWNLPRTPLTSS